MRVYVEDMYKVALVSNVCLLPVWLNNPLVAISLNYLIVCFMIFLDIGSVTNETV